MIAYLFTATLAALALQHIAYIIQYGSIFECQRSWIKTCRWKWADELIHCQLCTTTQLALWLWAFPVWLWEGTPRELGVAGPYVAFGIVWLSEASLALVAWDLCRFVGRGTDALILRARQGVK